MQDLCKVNFFILNLSTILMLSYRMHHGKPSLFVNETSMLRRHLGVYHQGCGILHLIYVLVYLIMGFSGCLLTLGYRKQVSVYAAKRYEGKKRAGWGTITITIADTNQLDLHLQERPVKEKVLPYSDKFFRKTAIKWLVLTDQVHRILYWYFVTK